MECTAKPKVTDQTGDLLLAGLASFAQGDEPKAWDLFARVLAEVGAPTLAELCMARLLLNRGDPVEAARLLEKVVDREPTLAEGHLLLGQAYRGMYRNDAAIRCFRRTLAIVTDHPQARERLDELTNVQDP